MARTNANGFNDEAAPDVIAALNDLLAAEQGALAQRAVESNVYVSPASVRDWEVVQRMARASRQNAAELTELILDLGGQPRPRVYDPATAGLHFGELGHVMPDLSRNHERVIATYRAALPRLAARAKASSLAGRILAEHENLAQRLAKPARSGIETAASAPAQAVA